MYKNIQRYSPTCILHKNMYTGTFMTSSRHFRHVIHLPVSPASCAPPVPSPPTQTASQHMRRERVYLICKPLLPTPPSTPARTPFPSSATPACTPFTATLALLSASVYVSMAEWARTKCLEFLRARSHGIEGVEKVSQAGVQNQRSWRRWRGKNGEVTGEKIVNRRPL